MDGGYSMLKVLASGVLALALATPLVASANDYGYCRIEDGHRVCDDRIRRHEVYRDRHSWQYAPPVVAVRPAYPVYQPVYPRVIYPPVYPRVAYPPVYPRPYAWAPPVYHGYDRDDWHG